jgi:hypothetical protein
MSPDDATAIALNVLVFLASDPARLNRFLGLTGLSPDRLRAEAGTAPLSMAILDHLLADESLLMVCAAELVIPAERFAAAHAVLSGAGSWHDG